MAKELILRIDGTEIDRVLCGIEKLTGAVQQLTESIDRLSERKCIGVINSFEKEKCDINRVVDEISKVLEREIENANRLA